MNTTKPRYPSMSVKENANVGVGREEPIPEGKSAFRSFLPLPATTVQPGHSCVVAASPQISFRGKRLVVAPECAGSFEINDVKVGNASIVFSGGSAPASCFPPLPLDEDSRKFLRELEEMVQIHMPRGGPSQCVSVHVTNISKEVATFRGLIWGEGEV